MAATDMLVTVKSFNHHDQLANRLWKHFQAKQNVDCDLNYCGRTVKLHKLLLDVLLLPDDQSAPSSNAGLHMPEKDCLDMMVEFLYLGTVDVCESQLKDLLKLATESNFKMLVDAIQQAIKREQDKNKPKTKKVYFTSKKAAQANQLSIMAKAGTTPPKTINTHSVVANKGHIQNHTKLPDKSQAQLQLGKQVTMSALTLPTNIIVKQEDSVSATKVKESSDRLLDSSLANPTVGASGHQFSIKSEPVDSDEHPSGASDDMDMDLVTHPANQATKKCNVCMKQLTLDMDCQNCATSRQNELNHKNSRENDESLVRALCSTEYLKAPESNYNNHNPDASHDDDNPEINNEIHPVATTHAKLFYCKGCNTFFRSQEALVAHKNSQQCVKIGQSFSCELCGKSFPNQMRLQKHHKIFHGKQILKCDKCPETFSTAEKLKEHRFQHGKKPYKCELCDKTYTRASYRREHQKAKHLGEFHVCEKCGRKFSDRGNMLRHIETHSDTKDHKCTLCPKAYTNIDALKAHIISHGEKRHKCDHCGKRFSLKGSLNYHLMTHAKNGIPIAQPKIIKRTRPQH